jgi:beta-phosphoglucomutase
MALQAVLFDFDGVIADTENHHIAAWQRTLSSVGWQVADEVAARSADVDDREFLSDLFVARGIQAAKIGEWVRRKQVLTLQLLKYSPRPYPGVVELIGRLRGRARLAIVSGTWRDNIQVVVDALGLANCFETIIGKEDTRSVKPDPEAYQLALQALGLSAGAAVAVEDSPAGLASARAAGIRAIAIGHRRPFGQWVGDATYISGFEPVDGFLRHLGL